MKDTERLGILILAERTFYYLEADNPVMNNNIDRLRSSLIAKSKIKYTTSKEETYKVINLAQAKENNYAIKVIYFNKHIKKRFENKAQAKESFNKAWGE